VIDKSYPWAFFDGDAEGDPMTCGGGGIIYLSENKHFSLKAGLGSDTNNFVELMALKLLLLFVIEKGIKMLQIYGDSLVVIIWANGLQRCHIMRLIPIVEELRLLKMFFDLICFTHVYKEHNRLADGLSKEVAGMAQWIWNIIDTHEHGSDAYCHKLFHDL